MGLNTEQERAVLCTDNLIVLAPPGSGKTGTLVAKVKHIIKSDPRAHVLLVTFTDASAKEARERIGKALSPKEMSRVEVNTFHSHAIEQLRRANKLGKILSPFEGTEMLKRALVDVGSTMDSMEAEAALQAAKSTPEFTGQETDFIAAYEARKYQARAIDLQDVIRETVWGMRATAKEKQVAPLKATHVLCDEFQDVDWNQLHWLLCYRELGAAVTVVGDDDQSVYGWRNSLGYDAMHEFQTRVSPTVIHLEVNYRSKSEILLYATKLVRNNQKRMDKNIVAAKGDGGEARIISAAEKAAEALEIVKYIEEDAVANDWTTDKLPNGRWGIIARNNRDLWMIAATLRKAGIPFTKSQKKDDAPWEVMTFCGLLVSIQTNDSLGLRQTLHAIGLSDKTVKVIHDAMGDEMFSLMDGECPVTEELPLEERKVLEEFMILSRNWRRLTAKGHYSHVVEAIGIYFLDQVVRGDDAKDDFESFVNILSRKATGSLQKRVMNFFNKEDKKSSAGVSLYTMHASKGLEFDRVFVAQCNSGTIPSAKSTSVEEERRLFYVAMTRARNDLTMSYISTKGRSPFLTESGVDLG